MKKLLFVFAVMTVVSGTTQLAHAGNCDSLWKEVDRAWTRAERVGSVDNLNWGYVLLDEAIDNALACEDSSQ